MIWIFFVSLLIWSLVFFWIDGAIVSESQVFSNADNDALSLGILIAVRNEDNAISMCLESIENQEWLPDNTSVYIVNDHSTDGTLKVIEHFRQSSKLNVHVLSLDQESGKKAAIRMGLSLINEELLYQCDGDVIIQPGTIGNMIRTMQQSNRPVVFGPVVYEEDGALGEILRAENLNTQVVSEAFLNRGNPLMVNGANMMMKSSMIDQYASTLESEAASGDDVFFAQSLSQFEYISGYYLDHAVMAKFPKSVASLFDQRVRWASKSSKYPKFLNRVFPAAIFCLNLIFVAAWLLLPFVDGMFWILLFFFGKWLIEFSFHRKWFQKYDVNHALFVSIMLTIFHPFYVSIIGISSVAGIGFNWKDRTYRR